MLDKTEKIEDILDLNPTGLIANSISDRQLKVITKAYLYLSRAKENNIIYIADEVGLGKTYIALGIITLFRYFNKHKDHRDLIIVPKQNLQVKWEKELGLFLHQNYIANPNKTAIPNVCVSDKLKICLEEDYNIFRMSSFSNVINVNGDEESSKLKLRNHLLDNIFKGDEYSRECINIAWRDKDYFLKANLPKLRHLVAYLLNVSSTKIDCLIVDEAHNYKYGPDDEWQGASIRNEVTARFLGALEDSVVFNDFEGLKKKVKFPLAHKIICLSATPKDVSLSEIKNQFNCFSFKHSLSKAKTTDDIKGLFSKFLIRGNMEYTFSDESISRNQSREEYRKGNVNKSEAPEVLEIKDDFQGIFWQLLQYQSLKQLTVKNGVEFEMGMLAGFESYSLDIDKRWKKPGNDQPDKEYDLVATTKKRDSEDVNVIREIMSSYVKAFKDELPPHPKQSKFENEILQQLKVQEKSLTFVRRVMTAHELESRILQKFEKEIVVEGLLNFKGRFETYNSKDVKVLIESWRTKDIRSKLPDLFNKLANKSSIKKLIQSYKTAEGLPVDSVDLLKYAYTIQDDLKIELNNAIKKEAKNVSQKLEVIALSAIELTKAKFLTLEGLDDEGVEESYDVDDKYFFNDYFKKGRDGYSLRTKMYRESWFELDLTHLNNVMHVFKFDALALNTALKKINFQEKTKKSQIYDYFDYELAHWLGENSTIAYNYSEATLIPAMPEAELTFLTRLLLDYCRAEFIEWLDKQRKKESPKILINELNTLEAILQGIMRNGTGLIPTFVADSSGVDFSEAMLDLIVAPDAPFHFVLTEIKTIILDYDLVVTMNFRGKSSREISTILRSLSPVLGISGLVKRNRSIVASQFRMPGYPYVLISTDILREGEDLHTYCQNVYHYGIAWNPSDMEQRTGRIDRINSLSYRKLIKEGALGFDSKIHVFYPYLSQSIEVNQVVKLLTNINVFIQTFNDISINNKFDTYASVDDQISDDHIPKTITHKIEALYDVQHFDLPVE